MKLLDNVEKWSELNTLNINCLKAKWNLKVFEGIIKAQINLLKYSWSSIRLLKKKNYFFVIFLFIFLKLLNLLFTFERGYLLVDITYLPHSIAQL